MPERGIVITIIYSLTPPSHLSSSLLHLSLQCSPLTPSSLSPSPIDVLSPRRLPAHPHSRWTSPWTVYPPHPTTMYLPLRHNSFPQGFQRPGRYLAFSPRSVPLVNHNHLIISFPGSLKTFLQDALSLKARNYSLSAKFPYIGAPNHDVQARLQFSPSLHTFPVQPRWRAKRSRFHPIIGAFRSPATSTTPCDQSSQTFFRAT